MNKSLITSIFTLCTTFAVQAQETVNVTVTNGSGKDRKCAPVVLRLDKFGMDVSSALVTADGTETPCQLDDIDQDGRADELCFLADVGAGAQRRFCVTLYETGKPRTYEPQV